jgi:uracil-DNA glycosylase
VRHCLDNVVDVGQVTLQLSSRKYRDRIAPQYLLREAEVRHVGPSPGTVDGKEMQSCGPQSEHMAAGMRHDLVCLLGRRVEASVLPRASFGFAVVRDTLASG